MVQPSFRLVQAKILGLNKLFGLSPIKPKKNLNPFIDFLYEKL